ncbi:MAG: hypothetical protein QOK28_2304 [Actinomycetota bacterium]|jgi:hypothetical protein
MALSRKHVVILAFVAALAVGIGATDCHGEKSASPPSTDDTDTVPGRSVAAGQCDTTKSSALQYVCGHMASMADRFIGLELRPTAQVAPAKITVLADGRVHYEEHLHEDARDVMSTFEGYENLLGGNAWVPLPDNADPKPVTPSSIDGRLHYQKTEGDATPVTYIVSIVLRGVPHKADHAMELFVDATIETAGPVL